jgi:hypothetical protein
MLDVTLEYKLLTSLANACRICYGAKGGGSMTTGSNYVGDYCKERERVVQSLTLTPSRRSMRMVSYRFAATVQISQFVRRVTNALNKKGRVFYVLSCHLSLNQLFLFNLPLGWLHRLLRATPLNFILIFYYYQFIFYCFTLIRISRFQVKLRQYDHGI